MAIKFKRKSKSVVGAIRRTQLITTFGCGSIIDLPYDSVIVAGTDYWTHFQEPEYIIHEENLQRLLGVDYFVLPKISSDTQNRTDDPSGDIPVFRFPEVLICPECGNLANYKKFGFTTKPICTKCNKDLIPSRFIIACKRGHLEDFPYSWWVHRGDFNGCNRPENLSMYNDKRSGGLESIWVECKTCKTSRNMAGAFNPDVFKGYKCRGKRPWLREDDPEDCNEGMKTLQRGASNLYFGIHESALSIPPWSKKIQQEINKNWERALKYIIHDEGALRAIIAGSKMYERCGCTVDDILEQIKLTDKNQKNKSPKTREDIFEDEYRAFLGENNSDENFKTMEVEVPELFKEFIEKIVLAKKLREVLVLKGFTRIYPSGAKEGDRNFTRISKKSKNWLPAIELKGEGIFIKLDSERLIEWEAKVETRYIEMEKHMSASINKRDNFSPRYVLLHTLSHMLIRQLTLQCGYSSSALKERIYSTFNRKDNIFEMEGILIYTSTPDAEGSLGGLVREGKTKNIDNTLRQMLEGASWCSSDPLCIQSRAQGIDSLNYAACHSCGLLPETSCESRNSFLDRAALIGTMDDRSIGYFSDLFEIEGQMRVDE